MSAIKKSILSLMKGDLTGKRTIEDVVAQIFESLKSCYTDEDDEDETVSWRDLHQYLTKASVSSKSIEQFYGTTSTEDTAALTDKDVAQGLCRCLKCLDEEAEYVAQAQSCSQHIVAGSSKLNNLSNTVAFRSKAVTQESMKRIRGVFEDLDHDGDGVISVAEFRSYVRKVKPDLEPMVPSIFRSLDEDRDGLVSFKQLVAKLYPQARPEDLKKLLAMANNTAHPKFRLALSINHKLLQEVKDIFVVYADNDGQCLDQEEFYHAMNTAGYPEAEVQKMYKEIDLDRSHEVTYRDFVAWYILDLAKKLALNIL